MVSGNFITGPNGAGVTYFSSYDSDGRKAQPTLLNDSGQMAGNYDVFGVSNHAFITGPNGIGMTVLGTLGGTDSYANAINASGQVVGSFLTSDGRQHAFMTGANGADMTELGTLDGSNNIATDINNSGQVVGYSYARGINSYTHAFITGPNGAGVTDLGAPDDKESLATGINDAGQVVGYFMDKGNEYYFGSSGFMYSHNGGMIDLSSLPAVTADGWTDLVPRPINNHGQIVGNGTHLGHTEAFLLSPIPEPQTYAMLLAGLGLIGFSLKRRENSSRLNA